MGGQDPRFGAERYLFGGGIVGLAVAVGNHFVASKIIVFTVVKLNVFGMARVMAHLVALWGHRGQRGRHRRSCRR